MKYTLNDLRELVVYIDRPLDFEKFQDFWIERDPCMINTLFSGDGFYNFTRHVVQKLTIYQSDAVKQELKVGMDEWLREANAIEGINDAIDDIVERNAPKSQDFDPMDHYNYAVGPMTYGEYQQWIGFWRCCYPDLSQIKNYDHTCAYRIQSLPDRNIVQYNQPGYYQREGVRVVSYEYFKKKVELYYDKTTAPQEPATSAIFDITRPDSYVVGFENKHQFNSWKDYWDKKIGEIYGTPYREGEHHRIYGNNLIFSESLDYYRDMKLPAMSYHEFFYYTNLTAGDIVRLKGDDVTDNSFRILSIMHGEVTLSELFPENKIQNILTEGNTGNGYIKCVTRTVSISQIFFPYKHDEIVDDGVSSRSTYLYYAYDHSTPTVDSKCSVADLVQCNEAEPVEDSDIIKYPKIL